MGVHFKVERKYNRKKMKVNACESTLCNNAPTSLEYTNKMSILGYWYLYIRNGINGISVCFCSSLRVLSGCPPIFYWRLEQNCLLFPGFSGEHFPVTVIVPSRDSVWKGHWPCPADHLCSICWQHVEMEWRWKQAARLDERIHRRAGNTRLHLLRQAHVGFIQFYPLNFCPC